MPTLLDPDTVASSTSYEAALLAAGCTLTAVDRGGFALVRPPGHHALPERAMGFCLVDNVAVAARYAQAELGIERVAIVDWDVHHGNGTQECFWDRSDVLTVSLHMHHGAWGPAHPQTGAPDEVGADPGAGFNVNVELPPGTGDGGYAKAFEQVVAPIVETFEPELLLIACGQDANQFDPGGRQCVTMEGFRRLGAAARDLAESHCEGRIVLVQEGGYARSYSAFCLHATLAGALGTDIGLDDPCAYMPDDPDHADAAIALVRSALAPYWNL